MTNIFHLGNFLFLTGEEEVRELGSVKFIDSQFSSFCSLTYLHRISLFFLWSF